MANEVDLDRWARWRFSIIGHLFSSPPQQGELRSTLETLAQQCWRHPINGTAVHISFATLERWYYAASKVDDPVAVLRRSPRDDTGRFRVLSPALVQALEAQYRAHSGWTVQLHYDNLTALAEEQSALHPLPSYGTLRRYMKALDYRRKKPPMRATPGGRQAAARLEKLEVRSYEADYVHALWHTDFHHGSRQVLTSTGIWVTPLLLAFIDDHSRLICHLQWYLEETAEVLVHGLHQALQKRGLPRALMSDNGAAMKAEEFQAGLHELGILHERTLPYSPYQNAKQENFWATLEGRLMAMLEDVKELTLERLNEITLAWVEQSYHHTLHTEIGVTPFRRYLDAPQVGRDSPASDALKKAFRCTVQRKQRRSDGTISLVGKRFEIPGHYRHLDKPMVRYARWDLRAVDLIDPQSLNILAPLYPLDKSANADGQRRSLNVDPADQAAPPSEALPPLLRKCLADYAATGRPPAYLPKPQEPTS